MRLAAGLVETRGRQLVDFTCWDYLSLNENSKFRRSAQTAIEQFGVGSASPRLSTGTQDSHLTCELRLARFFGTDSALLFSSKPQAVFTLLTTLLSEQDVVLYDEFCQSPVVDAAFLVQAHAHPFRVEDPTSLELELEKSRFAQRKIIFIEALSPVTARSVDLNKLALIARKHGASIVIDESYAVGATGLRGAGLSELLLSNDVLAAVICDLSLGLCSYGACVAGSSDLRTYLLSRSKVLSSECAPPAAFVSAAEKAIDIIELQTLAREMICARAQRLTSGFAELGLTKLSGEKSPITFILFEKRSLASEYASSILHKGFLADVVPRGTQLSESCCVRFVIRAAHTEQQIDTLLQATSDIRQRLSK